jgi:hypothetical protein
MDVAVQAGLLAALAMYLKSTWWIWVAAALLLLSNVFCYLLSSKEGKGLLL